MRPLPAPAGRSNRSSTKNTTSSVATNSMAAPAAKVP
jgi:hypothetical protein